MKKQWITHILILLMCAGYSSIGHPQTGKKIQINVSQTSPEEAKKNRHLFDMFIPGGEYNVFLLSFGDSQKVQSVQQETVGLIQDSSRKLGISIEVKSSNNPYSPPDIQEARQFGKNLFANLIVWKGKKENGENLRYAEVSFQKQPRIEEGRISANPECIRTLVLAKYYYNKENFGSAIAELEKIMKQCSPNIPDILFQYGGASYALGNKEAALKSFEAVLKLDPANSDARKNIRLLKGQ